jgi:hypothetical protein
MPVVAVEQDLQATRWTATANEDPPGYADDDHADEE